MWFPHTIDVSPKVDSQPLEDVEIVNQHFILVFFQSRTFTSFVRSITNSKTYKISQFSPLFNYKIYHTFIYKSMKWYEKVQKTYLLNDHTLHKDIKVIYKI